MPDVDIGFDERSCIEVIRHEASLPVEPAVPVQKGIQAATVALCGCRATTGADSACQGHGSA